MSASEHDSFKLDTLRRRNDELTAENARLREEIARRVDQRNKLYWDIRDLMEKV